MTLDSDELMRTIRVFAFVAAVGLLAGGCGGGMTTGSYSETIGTSSRTTVRKHVPNILQSEYGYRIDRRNERSGYLRYVTYWKEEGTVQDERERGFSSVRTRITITARPRDRNVGTYTVQMDVDYQVKKEGSTDWVPEELTSDREDRIDQIYQDLSDRLTGGVIER